MRLILTVFVTFTLATTIGCSIIDSSGSISDSISSPSKSISNSSSGDDGSESPPSEAPAPETKEETTSYREDVSQLTVTYLASGGDMGAFGSALSELAAERGITDWEADADTGLAIGAGAGTAGLDEADFNAFASKLFGEDIAKLNTLRLGYEQTAPVSQGEKKAATQPDRKLEKAAKAS
jgi:hypothetical protein